MSLGGYGQEKEADAHVQGIIDTVTKWSRSRWTWKVFSDWLRLLTIAAKRDCQQGLQALLSGPQSRELQEPSGCGHQLPHQGMRSSGSSEWPWHPLKCLFLLSRSTLAMSICMWRFTSHSHIPARDLNWKMSSSTRPEMTHLPRSVLFRESSMFSNFTAL